MTGKSRGRLRTVDELYRRYIRSEAAQFVRSAEDLLRQAEGQVRGDVRPSGVAQE